MHVKVVWVTMLAMADRYGYVGASVNGLADAAKVTPDQAREALEMFMAPDLDSRSEEFEGRRIEKADRGWNILNYDRFRDMRDEEARREYERVRKREQRAAAKLSRTKRDKSQVSHFVPVRHEKSAQAEASASEDQIQEKKPAARDMFVLKWEARYAEKYPFAPKDGVQIAALLKGSPELADRWGEIVDRYLADPWPGENGRHGLAALCSQIVKYSGPAPALKPKPRQEAIKMPPVSFK